MEQYAVKPGDTLSKIAYRNKIRVDDLLLYNKHIRSKESYLKVGSNLFIPEPSSLVDMESYSKECLHEYGWRELENDRLTFGPLVKNKAIGQSRMGKPIWLFKLGEGNKKIFISGTWHGNEWLNTWLLMNFIKELEVKEKLHESWHGLDITALLSDVSLYIVPLVNPDGAEIVQEGLQNQHSYHRKTIHDINEGFHCFKHWSANAAGVDLNHQWPAGWKEESRTSPERPFPRHYSGEAPLSEPEAKSVYQLTMEEEFSMVLAFHSQGEEIFWGYRNMEPKESRMMAERLARVSSYKSVQCADSSAGYKDWFIKEFKRPGFTIETGVGQNPLPFEASARIWITAVPLLLESCLLL